jgi:hypothetical protein
VVVVLVVVDVTKDRPVQCQLAIPYDSLRIVRASNFFSSAKSQNAPNRINPNGFIFSFIRPNGSS